RVFRVRLEQDSKTAPEEAKDAAVATAISKKPSIAVLPLVNMSGDPEQEFFADGLTEDIITELSRFHDLLVISRNSTFVYKGKAVKVQEVAREFGVEYILEGSVRKAGDRIRVTVQLIDAETDRHIWAERYERLLDRAIALDPNYAHAHAWKACVLGQTWVYGWYVDRDATFQQVSKELEIALALDDNDSDVHRILAALNLNNKDHDKASYHQER